MDGSQRDALSDVLRLIRLRSQIYFLRDFSAPWGMQMDDAPVGQFHLVVRGQCWLEAVGEQRMLGSGDVVLFPLGDAHRMTDQPSGEAVPGPQVMAAIQAGEPIFEDGAVSTTLLCGHFEFDRDLRHPLLQALPRLIHSKGMARRNPGWLDSVTGVLVSETGSGAPGADVVVNRLAEVLFIQVLRDYLLEDRPDHGFLAALHDPRLCQALSCIHRSVQGDLTLAEIARAAGMSRSNLASRFKAVMGVTPMGYLIQWRLLQASELLRTSEDPVATIAGRVGYASEAAFSRAFKRLFAQSPSLFRAGQDAAAGAD